MDQQAAFGGDDNGLILIVDVSMGRNFNPIGIEGFKYHDGGACQGAGIQGVGQFYSAAACLCHKFCFGSDLHAVHQKGFTSPLIHKDSGNSVGLAGVKSAVFHRVHNGDLPDGVGSVLAIYSGSGADLRSFNKGDRLALIFQVLMAGDLGFA